MAISRGQKGILIESTDGNVIIPATGLTNRGDKGILVPATDGMVGLKLISEPACPDCYDYQFNKMSVYVEDVTEASGVDFKGNVNGKLFTLEADPTQDCFWWGPDIIIDDNGTDYNYKVGAFYYRPNDINAWHRSSTCAGLGYMWFGIWRDEDGYRPHEDYSRPPYTCWRMWSTDKTVIFARLQRAVAEDPNRTTQCLDLSSNDYNRLLALTTPDPVGTGGLGTARTYNVADVTEQTSAKLSVGFNSNCEDPDGGTTAVAQMVITFSGVQGCTGNWAVDVSALNDTFVVPHYVTSPGVDTPIYWAQSIWIPSTVRDENGTYHTDFPVSYTIYLRFNSTTSGYLRVIKEDTQIGFINSTYDSGNCIFFGSFSYASKECGWQTVVVNNSMTLGGCGGSSGTGCSVARAYGGSATITPQIP